jgi:hypothetical protein
MSANPWEPINSLKEFDGTLRDPALNNAYADLRKATITAEIGKAALIARAALEGYVVKHALSTRPPICRRWKAGAPIRVTSGRLPAATPESWLIWIAPIARAVRDENRKY